MSEIYGEEELEAEVESDHGDGEAGDIKSLRRAASGKKKLEQELADAKRQLAFAKAGIDPEDPKMKYFVRGYDGEMSAGAVRQAAIEAGFIQSQSDSGAAQAAQSAQERVMSASAGAVIEDASEEAALSRMQAALEEGGMEAMLDVARQYGIPIGTEM
jgi:hypothetical protein